MDDTVNLRLMGPTIALILVLLAPSAEAQLLPWTSAEPEAEVALDQDPTARLVRQLTSKERELTDRLDQERARWTWVRDRLEARRNTVAERGAAWTLEREALGPRLSRPLEISIDETIDRLTASREGFDLLLEQTNDGLDALNEALSLVRTLRIGVEAGPGGDGTHTLEGVREEVLRVENALRSVRERHRILVGRREEVWERLTIDESRLDQARTGRLELERRIDERDRAVNALAPEAAAIAHHLRRTTRESCTSFSVEAHERRVETLRSLPLLHLAEWTVGLLRPIVHTNLPERTSFSLDRVADTLYQRSTQNTVAARARAAVGRARAGRSNALINAAEAVALVTIESDVGRRLVLAQAMTEVSRLEVQCDVWRVELDSLNVELEKIFLRRTVLTHWHEFWSEARDEAEARAEGGTLSRNENAFSAASLQALTQGVTGLLASPGRYASVFEEASIWQVISLVIVFVLLLAAYVIGRWATKKVNGWPKPARGGTVGRESLRGFVRSAPVSVVALGLLLVGWIPAQWHPLTWFIACLPLGAVAMSANQALFPREGNRRVNADTARYFRRLVRYTIVCFTAILGVRFLIVGLGVQAAAVAPLDGAAMGVLALAWAFALGRKTDFLRLMGADGSTDEIGLVKASLRRLHTVILIAPAALAVLHIVGYHNLAEAMLGRGFVVVVALLIGPWAHQRSHEMAQRLVGYPRGGGPFRLEADRSLMAYRMIAPLVSLGILLLGFTVVLSAWGHQESLVGNARGAVNYPLMTVGNSNVSPLSIFLFALTLLGALVVKNWLLAFLRERFYPLYNLSAGHLAAVDMIVTYLVLIVGTLVGLNIIGIGLGVFAVFAGIVGIGLGFGSQTLAANFISGLILHMRGPVTVGDVIEVDGLLGEVTRISATWTVVRTHDNFEVILPNSALLNSSVTNWTRGEKHVRMSVEVGVSYGSDVPRVTELLLGVGSAHRLVRSAPAPSVQFADFGDSSLNFILLVWIDHALAGPVVRSQLRYEINRVFAENDVVIPFPQRDLHLRSSETSVEIARGRGWAVVDEPSQESD